MTDTTTTNGQSLPYVMAYGRIKTTLEEIIKASVPDRITQDYLTTKLGIKGGSGKAMLPFLKKIGFLNSDGTPTETYLDFRIPSTRARAMNQTILHAYFALGEMNEYFYELNDKDLKDLVVRATGMAATSSTVGSIIGCIKSLKEYADFNVQGNDNVEQNTNGTPPPQTEIKLVDDHKQSRPNNQLNPLSDIRLGYTININLPATSDISVYNAIFKSLRDNILDE